MHKAAMRGRKKRVKLLLEKGAIVEVRNVEGKIPLDCADERGHNELGKLLKKKVIIIRLNSYCY